MPETDFGMPGMTQIMARPACQGIWHTGHVRKFGMPGMPEILLGMNYLLLEPKLLAAWVRSHRTSNYAYRACEILLHANFNAKPLWGHPLYYQ